MSIVEATANAAGTWQLDPVHSSVAFEVEYLIGTCKGEFGAVTASLTVDGTGGRLEGSAPVTGVRVRDENLAVHLQAPNFFDAERHPQLTFAADGIELDT